MSMRNETYNSENNDGGLAWLRICAFVETFALTLDLCRWIDRGTFLDGVPVPMLNVGTLRGVLTFKSFDGDIILVLAIID